MRPYELMYIINPQKSEEEIVALIAGVNGAIESLGGKVESVFQTEPWGRRRLAYPLQKLEEGYYVLTHFSAGVERLGELERYLKLSDGILRYLLTRRP